MHTETFEHLPEEKRLAILNAGFICFGKSGYEKTSISDIAKAAGVSKASLFHYFGTKRELYIYLYCFSCKEILKRIQEGTDDFFECITIAIKNKLEAMEFHPGMEEFLSSVVLEEESFLAQLQQYEARSIAEGYAKLFAHVDYGRFRNDVSFEVARNIVNWVNSGYLKANVGKKSTAELAEELAQYLSIMKRAVYKEEFI